MKTETVEAEIVEENQVVLKEIKSLAELVKTSPLVEKYKDVSEIDINQEVSVIAERFLEIEKGHKELRKNINLVKKERLAYTAPALKYQKNCISIEKDVLKILEPISDKLKALKDKVENEETRKQQEIEEKEEARVHKIQTKMKDYESYPLTCLSMSSINLNTVIVQDIEVPTAEIFEEFFDEAMDKYLLCTNQLKTMRDNKELVENAQAIQDEANAKALIVEDERLAKQKQEQEEFEAKQAAFRKEQSDFANQQRAIQDEADRKQAEKEAVELMEKQANDKAKKEEVDKESFNERYIETINDLKKIMPTIEERLLNQIIKGKIRHLKWS